MRCELEVSRGEIRAGAHLKARTIAIVPGRRRVQLDFTGQFELGDAAQVLAQNFFFDLELQLVSSVLVVASAAAAEVWTRGRNAMRRTLDDCRGVRSREAGLFFGYGGLCFFAPQEARGRNRLCAAPRCSQ